MVAVAIYGLLSLIKNDASHGIVSVMMEYKWAFVLGAFSFLTVQYLDAALIKSKIFKRQY
jgi:hypothetical protein